MQQFGEVFMTKAHEEWANTARYYRPMFSPDGNNLQHNVYSCQYLEMLAYDQQALYEIIREGNLADVAILATVLKIQFIGEAGYSVAPQAHLKQFIDVMTERCDIETHYYILDVFEKVWNIASRRLQELADTKDEMEENSHIRPANIFLNWDNDSAIPETLECMGQAYDNWTEYHSAVSLETDVKFALAILAQSQECMNILGACHRRAVDKAEHKGGIMTYFSPILHQPDHSLDLPELEYDGSNPCISI